MDWRHKAACLDEDPELFFPIGNTGPALLQIEEAKQVCRRCDVRDACLQWALEAGQDHGVWGGLSEDERRALKRRAARAGSAPPDRQTEERRESPAFVRCPDPAELPGSEGDLDHRAGARTIGLRAELEDALQLRDEGAHDGQSKAPRRTPIEVRRQAAAVVADLDPEPTVDGGRYHPDLARNGRPARARPRSGRAR